MISRAGMGNPALILIKRELRFAGTATDNAVFSA